MCQWDFPVDEPVSLPLYRRRRLDEVVPLIAERMRAGASLRALAREYGVSREAIRRALARAGFTVRVEKERPPNSQPRQERAHRLPGRGRSRAFRPAEVVELERRHRSGESLRALARTTGVSHETIRRMLAEAAQSNGERVIA